MNIFNKLKLVAGLKSEETKQKDTDNHYQIEQNDTIDVIFAKTLIQNNGNFFYCDNKNELIKTIKALVPNLGVETIYCIEPILKELLSELEINYSDTSYLSCNAILSSCEYLIANQGKIMLSSQQIGANNIKKLPKEHIIIAYTSQIVKSLNEGMSGINLRYIDHLSSTITTIKSNHNKNTNNTEGNIKNLSVILVEDFNIKK